MNIVVLGAGTAGLVTALMLREKYPFYNITIVKSGEIGIIGVGEGSTEHWATFMDFVGINLVELIHETEATIKIGILFKDWCDGPSEYVHSISQFQLSGLDRPELFNHLYVNSNKKFALSPNFADTFYKNLIPLKSNLRPSNQYHFDTFKLNDFLVKLCKERSILFVDAVVNDIIQDDQGNVTGLLTEQENITGDLFIDCSGFRRVISSKLGVKWKSKTENLPLNHAIAFPTEFDNPEEIEPYTTATALSSGWSWKIPTQRRYGNGYVFNSNYISTDEALAEINKSINRNVEKAARDIKFEAGKVDKFWIKNVINVGLSSSFAEPLEAQSIGFTIIQAKTLLSYLDTWEFNKNISEEYNNEMDTVFDNIIDYLQLHYLGNRNDSKFWKDRPFTITEFLKTNLKQFQQGVIEPSLFNNDKLMFRTGNFYQVLAGLGLIDKNAVINRLNRNRVEYNEANKNLAYTTELNYKPENIISHYDYIKLISKNYNYRMKQNAN